MTDELRGKIMQYRIAVNVLKRLLNAGIISEGEYAEMDTIVAKKCGLNSSTIFR